VCARDGRVTFIATTKMEHHRNFFPFTGLTDGSPEQMLGVS